MAERPELFKLAERAGLLPGYHDIHGTWHPLKASAAEALLAAMGMDGSSEEASARVLAELQRRERGRLLRSTRVFRQGASAADQLSWSIPADHPALAGAKQIEWRLEVQTERGEVLAQEGKAELTQAAVEMRMTPPWKPQTGYHTVRLQVHGQGLDRQAEQRLIVAPHRCFRPQDRNARRRHWGILANLYTLRSERNWGVGDLTDLEQLGEWAAGHGASFVGANPLHALRNRDFEICPYNPLSRLFDNYLYLDVERIPELAQTPEARDRLSSAGFQARLSELRRADQVDYESVAAAKLPMLRFLHATFRRLHGGQSTDRAAAYSRFVNQWGESLARFAAFMALNEWLPETGQAARGADWREWPAEFHTPNSPAVRRFCDEHADRVDFHRYVQFELDRQLAAAGDGLMAKGMSLGVYLDLAIGSSGAGADSWMYPDLFARGVNLGAPPDPYSATGQTWGFPPLIPQRLHERGYDYTVQLLRSSLRRAGILRIDHVLGLFRQFWVPDGQPGTEGAFVRFPADDLLSVLALESERHQAVVIGEDLGTVPPEVPPALEDHGIFSMRLVHFERHDGEFRSPAEYPENALVTVSTHDHPPFRGFWEGDDIDLRRRIGVIESEEEAERQRQERAETRRALARRLIEEGLLEESLAGDYEAVVVAVHRMLARTRSPMIAALLDDLAGETVPVNLPGITHDRFAAWSRKMSKSLDELFRDALLGEALDKMQEEMRTNGS